MSGVSKLVAEKNQRILLELVSQPGNDICADCKSRAPRWASHNLGIFICVRCASIHRKIGTHVTKVKSLTLDQWSKEQVENMKNIGNIKSNEYWNPDAVRHPPPANLEESERDSELEKYIRSKYEYKRFRSSTQHLQQRAAEILGPSQSKTSLGVPARSKTAPIGSMTASQPSSSANIPSISTPSSNSVLTSQPTLSTPSTSQIRSASAGIPAFASAPSVTASSSANSSFASQTFTPSARTSSTNPFPLASTSQPPAIPPNQKASLKSETFDDLVSLQTPSLNTTLPLQFQPTSNFGQQLQAQLGSPIVSSPTTNFTGTNPYANLSASTPTGPGPVFPSTFDHSPNFRSGSLPVFGQPTGVAPLAMTATGIGGGMGMRTNPFQQQQQAFGVGTPSFSTPTTGPSATNPFNVQFGLQAQQQQQQMFTPNAFSPQPQAAGMGGSGGMLQATPSPFRQTPSPFAATTPTRASQPGPQPTQLQMQAQPMPMQQSQQPQISSAFPASNSPYSQQAQQAQQLFQSMHTGGGPSNNPFGRQWG